MGRALTGEGFGYLIDGALFSLQACPMNMKPHADPLKTPQEIWEDFSLSFTPAVREVVEFAKHIPGFGALSQNDQVALLKAGTFEVQWLLRDV